MTKRVLKRDGQPDLVVYEGKLEYSTKEAAEKDLLSRGIYTEVEGQLVNAKGIHEVVHLGNIVLQAGEYDAEGNETKAPVFSTKWHLDIMTEEEFSFGSNEVKLAEGQPAAHSFA